MWLMGQNWDIQTSSRIYIAPVIFVEVKNGRQCSELNVHYMKQGDFFDNELDADDLIEGSI